MHRHQSSSTQSISSTSMLPSDSLLPIVQCPNCGIDVKRLVSGTTANPQRIFYRCVNYKKKTCSCRFWMWEEDYEAYLRDIGVVGMRSDPEHDQSESDRIFPNRIVARFDNEIGKLKKQNSQIVALAEKIIFLLVINVVVMMSILIVIMRK
ncbi:GRF zinc finger [Carex littledalei]|uniref:GRF zinc finger n=1 Tax=Carex littledalei TaxID=544730 RepID=A0A833R483_9POAL|nr:GRF zinc finger [Carex littledalei]